MTIRTYVLLPTLVAAMTLSVSTASAEKNPKTKQSSASKARAPKSKAGTQPSATRPTASTGKAKNYDFTGDDIDGSRVLPDNTTIFGRDVAEHQSLIRLRTEFIGEIIRSADML